MSHASYLARHPLFNARARVRVFNELLLRTHKAIDKARFDMAIPPELQRYAENPELEGLLDDRLRHWLSDYFPGAKVDLGEVKNLSDDPVPGEPEYKRIHVTVWGRQAQELLAGFKQGEAGSLKNHHVAILDATRTEEEDRALYLMQRVASELKPTGSDSISVRFSVPKNYTEQFRMDFTKKYGDEVLFKKEYGAVMMSVPAILRGETARKFQDDYATFKTAQHISR